MITCYIKFLNNNKNNKFCTKLNLSQKYISILWFQFKSKILKKKIIYFNESLHSNLFYHLLAKYPLEY